jgi:hypothetical protein
MRRFDAARCGSETRLWRVRNFSHGGTQGRRGDGNAQSPLPMRGFARFTRARARTGRECANASAERSEAREDDARRRWAFRVASPLVMASCGSRCGWNDLGSPPARAPTSFHYPCFAGGSATRDVRRPPRRALGLRCAPPSATFNVLACQREGAARAALEQSNTRAERSEAREDDARRRWAFRVASPLVMAMRGSCAGCNDA